MAKVSYRGVEYFKVDVEYGDILSIEDAVCGTDSKGRKISFQISTRTVTYVEREEGNSGYLRRVEGPGLGCFVAARVQMLKDGKRFGSSQDWKEFSETSEAIAWARKKADERAKKYHN